MGLQILKKSINKLNLPQTIEAYTKLAERFELKINTIVIPVGHNIFTKNLISLVIILEGNQSNIDNFEDSIKV